MDTVAPKFYETRLSADAIWKKKKAYRSLTKGDEIFAVYMGFYIDFTYLFSFIAVA